MLVSLLDKEKGSLPPYMESEVEGSPYIESLTDELEALKQKVEGGTGTSQTRPKVPEPKPFDSLRDAKALKSFVWDLEQYFLAAHIRGKDKVDVTTMYLSGDHVRSMTKNPVERASRHRRR